MKPTTSPGVPGQRSGRAVRPGPRLTQTGKPDPAPAGRRSSRELNGVFLCSYDTRRAGPDRADAPKLFRRHGLRDRHAGLALQATGTDRPRAHPELILGEGNLLPFHFLRSGDRIGRAVVKIRRDDGAVGTGFLVGPGILLTNHHVLPDARTAAAAQVHANHEVSPPPEPAGRVAVVPLRPETLFVTDADLDFTFCGVEGLDDLGTVPLERDSLNILPSEFVNIIQHPRGRPKEVALQDNRVVKVDNVVVHYCCDTEPGSSGSPVFNNQWQLVALHHASVIDDGPPGRPARGLDPHVRYLNEGIRISAIAVWLETVNAHAPGLHEALARLRGLFGGLDPQVGYFGALGRRTHAASAAEAVVECYQGDAGDLDLAFWDLAPLGPEPMTRLSELGWVIASMCIDLWCLAHVNRELLRALCDHLEAHFRLDYQYLVEPGADGTTLAVLYRRAALQSVEWAEPGEPETPSRLLIRANDASGQPASLELVPVLAPDRPGGRRRTRLCPATVAAGRLDPAADLLLIGDGLGTRDIQALATATTFRAALGAEGAFALLAGADSPFGSLFVSPNLNHTYGPSESLIVTRHRRWPATLDDLGSGRPIALRLAFAPLEPPPPTPAPPPAAIPASAEPAPLAGSNLNPLLEQALREILARFEAEARRRDPAPPAG